MNSSFPPAWTHRQQRPDLVKQLAANDRTDTHWAAAERWSWPVFGWGVAAGFYLGCIVTAAAAWVWSLYL